MHDRRRGRKSRLEQTQVESNTRLEKERDRTSLAEELPLTIGTSLDAFESLNIRQQKAHLHTILKSAYIYTDGRIELEFRK